MPEQILYAEWKQSLANGDNAMFESSDEEEAPATIAPTDTNIQLQTQQSVQNTIEPIKVEFQCYVCQKNSSEDQMVHCSSCPRHSHPSCLELNPKLVDWNCIRNYKWQCMDCKMCSTCNKAHDEDKMMFCDRCDRGYHTYCVGVKEVPSGAWLCSTCLTSEPKLQSQLNGLNAMNNSNSSSNSPLLKTPVKSKHNNSDSVKNTASPKRGRPLGSLNKPKENKPDSKASKEKKSDADVKEEVNDVSVSETPKKG